LCYSAVAMMLTCPFCSLALLPSGECPRGCTAIHMRAVGIAIFLILMGLAAYNLGMHLNMS
jgi:hypothetical protein